MNHPNFGWAITADDLAPVANVWINGFHYDPSSSPETGEFIEIAGAAGVDLSGYRIVPYNGGNGSPYALAGGSSAGIPLSGIIGESANGFGFASVSAPGLQNGEPDGIGGLAHRDRGRFTTEDTGDTEGNAMDPDPGARQPAS